MLNTFRPGSSVEIQEIVTWAANETQPLDIISGGSKRALGRPSDAKRILDVSAITGVIDYDPSELVLTAKAATPLEEIETILTAHNQMLAFEPPDWRSLLGSNGTPTLAGMIAINLSGPRRIRAGAVRDHFLGFSAVNGRGEHWKAGGRVIKNVTGYDMCKLQAGAFGTLSVLLDVTLKVLPKPETSCSVMLFGLADQAAIFEMSRALNSQHEVSAAAHLPANIAARLGYSQAVTLLRLEGPEPSVDYRADVVAAMSSNSTKLNASSSTVLWSKIAAVQPLLDTKNKTLWRICPIPSASYAAFYKIKSLIGSAEGFYDWGGGLLWVSVDDDVSDGGAKLIRAVMAEIGGTTMLFRAPQSIRQSVAVFEPMNKALSALTRCVKVSFDPHGILNPGRMREGQ
jgi:glycolate oxidase FAD binding subunit